MVLFECAQNALLGVNKVKDIHGPSFNEEPLAVETTKVTYACGKCGLFRHNTVCVPRLTFTHNESLKCCRTFTQ